MEVAGQQLTVWQADNSHFAIITHEPGQSVWLAQRSKAAPTHPVIRPRRAAHAEEPSFPLPHHALNQNVQAPAVEST